MIVEKMLGRWLFRGEILILKSWLKGRLFFVFKGVEFEAVGFRYNGSPLQIVTGWKLIRTDDVF